MLTPGQTGWGDPLAFSMSKSSLQRALANSFLAGEPYLEQLVSRASRTLGRDWRWLRSLAHRYLKRFAGQTRPRHRDVVRFLNDDSGFRRAWLQNHSELTVAHWVTEPPRMQPVAAAESWKIPSISSAGDLAAWLGLSIGELQWFEDVRRLVYKEGSSKLRHYHYRVVAKQFGAVRLIEAPKPRLKTLQRQILSQILEQIPAHPAAHGFIKGRSIKTFVSPHVGRRVILRMDLQDFFPSFAAARIQALFRTFGYPESVANLLAGICTTTTPQSVWEGTGFDVSLKQLQEARILYSNAHLPQGAPTSPALANLCTYRVDCRLRGLASAAGAAYTRYADDLAFSGDTQFEQGIERFSNHAAAIILEEGFAVHFRKTRIMRRGVRQHLAGIVTNHHINIMRPDFDRLKAILTNCVRLGPQSQNRDAHSHFRLHLKPSRLSNPESPR